MPDDIRKLVSVKEGKIVQFDFSQLEMVAAAQLSGDPQFLHDVTHSDVHYETGKEVMGWKTRDDMDKHSRRKVKGINFGIIYGGGYKTLSQQTGVPENLVKRQINAFKRRYPIFAEWQRDLKETVNATPGCSPVFRDGEAYYLHPWVSVTGRTYMFRDKKRKWDGKIGPNPSEIVNYPVQGFATGDIVPLLLAYAHGYYNMMNMYPFLAVHDSCVGVLLNGRDETEVELEVNLMETYLPTLIKNVYGVTMKAPLKLDVEIKDTWT